MKHSCAERHGQYQAQPTFLCTAEIGPFSSPTGRPRSAVRGKLAGPAKVIHLAGDVASQRDGEIVALCVVVVPEQLPPSVEETHVERERQILEEARRHALSHDDGIARVRQNPAAVSPRGPKLGLRACKTSAIVTIHQRVAKRINVRLTAGPPARGDLCLSIVAAISGTSC